MAPVKGRTGRDRHATMAPDELDPTASEFGRVAATVMFTDMVGYSELTQRDEVGALRLLNEHRRIVRPLLAEHGGREVKTIGDAFMVEFSDATAAAQCALAIQRQHAERNRNPAVPAITIRIGLHAGDVIHQDGDLYGDTVNIASRIEPLAPPGGICLSAPVFESAQAHLDVVAVPVGPATLKNIQLPVPIYRIDLRAERHVPMREGPWVDREAELTRLEAALADANEGKSRLVLIEGESGLGKTRLAEQLIRAATRHGARVVWGRASDESSAAPYSVWVQALEALAADLPAEVLQAGTYAGPLERLAPRLPLRAETTEGEVGADLDAARERLFVGISHFFRELARSSPIVLFLDDLQWADSASLRLLESFVASSGEGRWLVLALYRPEFRGSTSVPAEVLGGLARRAGVDRIALDRLPLPAIRQLVLALVKTKAIPDELVRQVFEKTGGNPYFVGEIIRALKEAGLLSGEAGQPAPKLPPNLPVPDSVRRLVRQRIERVDEDVVTFLRTVAVLGPEFPSSPLPRLTGLNAEAMIDRLGSAVALGLVSEETDEQGTLRYRFPDRLVWETLYSDSPVARRQKDHRRAGEALEELVKAGQRIPAAELAHHFHRAQATDRALEYSIRAAEEAGRLSAREEAVRHYRDALAVLEARPDERRRGQILEAVGDHLYRLGQVEVGQSTRREAAAAFERLGLLREAGNLHRKIAHGMREDPTAARHHWEEARRLLEALPESPELARLYTTIAGYLYEDGDPGGAGDLYARAIAVARRVEDPQTQVAGEIVLAGLRPVEEADRVFADLAEALEVAQQRGLDELVPNLYMVLGLARLHVQGDGAGAMAAVEAALAAARRTKDVFSERTVEANLAAFIEWRRGDYDRALRTVAAHLQYAGGDPRKLLPTALLVDADIALTRGDAERAAGNLDEVDALLENGGDWSERAHLRNVRARFELRRGRLPKARALLTEAHDLAVRAGVPAVMAALHAETLGLELEAALQGGESAAAEKALALLEDLSRRSAQSTVRAYATRGDGLRRAAVGDSVGGIAKLTEAIDLWERLGWQYELASTRLELAQVSRQSGAPELADALEGAAKEYLELIRVPASRSST